VLLRLKCLKFPLRRVAVRPLPISPRFHETDLAVVLLQAADLLAKCLRLQLRRAVIDYRLDAFRAFSGVNFSQKLIDVSQSVAGEDCMVVVAVGN
jgi:hypothetical protein